MKRRLFKILLYLLGLVFISIIVFISYFLISTSKYNLINEKLTENKREIIYYDINNNRIYDNENPQQYVKFENIPQNLVNAFISIEDKRFYSHKGIDYLGLLRAGINNLKSLSFKEGGSTISQQLIKNTHLTSEKTINRKLIEIKLTKELEKKFTKNEIVEIYLNTIYFGKNSYGIHSASKNYFNKSPKELTLSECATLAGIVKAPSYYSPLNNINECKKRRNIVLKSMLKENFINNSDYENAKNSPIITHNIKPNHHGYFSILNIEIDKIIEKNPYSNEKIYVYTYFDKEKQKILEESFDKDDDYKNSGIILDKKNRILGYYSNCFEEKRQMGSTIKPLLVYAPAINENIVSESSLILDEKTDFGNYSPSNYGDKYYGYVSVRDSLNKSLNVPTVKLLDYLGVRKAKEYVNKTGISLTDNDKTLGIALGSCEKGATLTEITSSYNVFINEGKYKKPSCIKKIVNKNGKILYKESQNENNVFEIDTVEIINDILKESKIYGTSKKLYDLKYDICSKTGTVGTKQGNTDAYNISYTTKYVVGVWYGNKNKLLPNSISGGTLPTETNKRIFQKIYKNTTPNPFTTKNLEKVKLDKNDYNNEHTLTLADENAPNKCILTGLFRKTAVPKKQSTHYSDPTIKILEKSVNNNVLTLRLCLIQDIEYKICMLKNKKEYELFDSKNIKNKNHFNIELEYDEIYELKVVPYYQTSDSIFFGTPIYLDKIKTPANNAGENWWNSNFN